MILENRARFLSACRYRSNSMATPRTKYQPMGVTWKPSSLICTRPLACRSSRAAIDRKSTRLNSSHGYISHPVFCLEKILDKIGDDFPGTAQIYARHLQQHVPRQFHPPPRVLILTRVLSQLRQFANATSGMTARGHM